MQTRRKTRSFLLAALVASMSLGITTIPALAHFLMLYPGTAARMPGGTLELLLAFTHPFAGAPMMELQNPLAVYFVRQRGNEGKPEKVDLAKTLQKIEFTGTDGKAVSAFKASPPRADVRSAGDYVFVVEPAPYYEATEDKYIQQFTKTVVNIGGIPGNWDRDVGLPTEIRPLDKPYATWTGGVFRGIVLSRGKPVPFASIEVQYMNHEPDLNAARWAGEDKIKLPHPVFETTTLKTDASGGFTIGLPKAGWWGIAALDVGPVKKFKGKPLSQDAVIWVQATDMK